MLQQVESLRGLCLDACAKAGLTVVTHAFHQFGEPKHPNGATGAVVLAESHLAVHTWPELQAVTLDVYACNINQDNGERVQTLYEMLHQTFRPGHEQTTRLRRGDLNPAT